MSDVLVFHANGQSLNADVSQSGKVGMIVTTQSVNGPGIRTKGYTNEIGGSSIDMSANGGLISGCIQWPGFNNVSAQAFSFLFRVVFFQTTGLQSIGGWGSGWNLNNSHMLLYYNAGTLNFLWNDAQTNRAFTIAPSWTPTTNHVYDIVGTWDGVSGHTATLYVDGVSVGTASATRARPADDRPNVAGLFMGAAEFDVNGVYCSYNEMAVWSNVINPTSVSLTSGNGSLNGISRSAYLQVTPFDGQSYTDPGIANVLSGVSYTYAGVSETGTLTSTDPGVGNVLAPTAYTINSVAKTGTFSDTDPGQPNVVSGVGYRINGVNKTGSYVEPTTAQVQHGVSFGGGIGTYRGADLWSDPGFTNVAQGVNYNADGVAKTGTLGTVTNTLQNATLTGQSLTATLVQT